MEVLPVICLASFSGPEISEQTGEQGEVVPFQRGARRQNYTSTKMSSLMIYKQCSTKVQQDTMYAKI